MELFYYFFLTIIIELPIAVIFYRKQWQKALLICFLLNAFTWPLLQVTLMEFGYNYIPLLELMIVFIEGIGYCLLFNSKLKYGLLVSFIANGLSYGLGFLI